MPSFFNFSIARNPLPSPAMSDQTDSVSKSSPGNGSESSTGFRSFWRKSDKQNAPQNAVFVEQDPTRRKSSRISRLLSGSSASTEDARSTGPPEANTAQKRRQQVYQAQKRHRNRKVEYVQSLEAEVARLQHLDAMVNSEKNVLAHENQAIKSFLASQALDIQLGGFSLDAPSTSGDDLSMLGSAAVDIRFDQLIEHERTFLDFDMEDIDWTSSNTSQSADATLDPVVLNQPVKGDSWAALDFILTLEWPCREHIHHPALNPEAKVSKACDVGLFHGHAFAMTSAVYQSSLPPHDSHHSHPQPLEGALAGYVGPEKGDEKWQLPHSEIDKLVELSEQLQLDDEQVTPAQAYAEIRRKLPKDDMLRPILEALKVPLAMFVQCSGFGAWMPFDVFHEQFQEALRSVAPELQS